MKLITILFSYCFILSSCIQEKPNTIRNHDTSQTTTLVKKEVQLVQASPAKKSAREIYWDEVKSMEKITGFCKYNISTINGENAISSAKSGNPITINQESLEITGWAFDEVNKIPAKDVILNIGGKLFDVDYGKPSAWLSREFNTNLTNCAFTCSINSNKIDIGTHDLSLIVLTKDGRFYMHHPNMIQYGQKFTIQKQ